MARRKGRPVDGVLLLHKPAGMTSNHALQRAKRLFFVEKAGHTGALDPLATGVLPLCFGEATKFSQFLLDADKGYRTCIRLGVTTDTCDADGEIIEQKSTAGITLAQVEAALKPLRGDILQVPPMYSALKLNGQPLYKMARQGVEVERAPRPVTIHKMDILAFRAGEAAEVELDILCTKGTYIRSIAVDLGEALGCGAHVKTLHRSQAGLFTESQCVTLEELEARFAAEQEAKGDDAGFAVLDSHLLSADAPVASLPAIELPANSAYYFRLGNPVMVSKVYRFGEQGAIVRVFCAETEQSPRVFLGLGSITGEGGVAPKRILANRSANEV
ncbi:tRNA pseudouridine(55) synthase TruB [Cellvibrio sp. pealriver]|uniref:tRNA pseudouridine(55) synthase TruB n=1 Tax=Cellvibrio sp. pealriver TaxID=1622269 RepID=UPI00066FE535|nr:tRNA pseudouridine(55) synthase TruB [Cellvibrio sp. pealriver]